MHLRSKLLFSGQRGQYSSFHWNASHFSGTDWDEPAERGNVKKKFFL